MSLLPPFADAGQYQDAMGSAPAGVDLALSAASDAIRNYCRWHVWPAVSETAVLDGRGGFDLLLPSLRVTAITSISETLRGAGEVAASVSLSDIEWSESGMIRRHDNRCWTTRYRGVTVAFTHGYDDLPDELVYLTLGVAGRALSNPLRLAQIQVGQRTEMYSGAGVTRSPGGLFADEMDALARYRRIV